MLTPEVMEQLLENHLKAQNLLTKKKSWCVKYSSLGGRGLHASRDINQGEIILSDSPIILGPRCYSKYLPMCIVCYKSGCPLFSCDNGCGLPICSADCENSINHINSECKHLKSWSVNCGAMWSMDLLQAVVPIRSLSLDDDKKRLVDALECHDCPRHGREIELLKKNISNEIAKSDEEFMRKVCRVFDTNAFETVVNIDGERSISLRGLFPLGALQNHSCTPNTRHYFTAQGLMVTRAAVAIKAGEELTMTYTDLLWDTSLRRRYLLESKHFECNCKRCSDPLELGSQLGAMRCADTDCYDFIYPDKPLNFETSWSCRKCKRKISKRQIGVIRSGIKSIVDSILLEPPRKILNFIETELSILVPPTNHIMMEMKFRIVSYFGRTDGLSWSDLTDQELNVKIKYCNDLLSVLEKLDLGDHQKKGLILYELYCTRKEKLARRKNKKQLLKEKCETNENKNQDIVDDDDDDDDEETECDNKLIDKVLEILRDDISAPSDLKNL